MPSNETSKIISAGLACFAAGLVIGAKWLNAPTHFQEDSIKVGQSAPEFIGAYNNSKAKTSSFAVPPTGQIPGLDSRLLAQAPLSLLKQAYDERMEELQKVAVSGFPAPSNEKEMKAQIDEALGKMQPFFSDKSYWSSHTEIGLGKNSAAVTFLFTINQPIEVVQCRPGGSSRVTSRKAVP